MTSFMRMPLKMLQTRLPMQVLGALAFSV